jgi:UDP-N-acetylglucosamine 2-epimerase (non-hydrolysing)
MAVVLAVVGTRPNFMKMAPVVAELRRRPESFRTVVVHTGQHYDDAMSKVFIDQLGFGAPDHALGVGSGTHAEQTARVLERLEPVLLAEHPDLVLVPGDVNSTLAAALAAEQAGIPVGHVEAGLRSFDRTMPEELNRVLTDQLSRWLFTHSPEARDNLLAEGRPEGAIHAVGNTMIDTLVAMREAIDAAGTAARLGLRDGAYLVATLHRPALVDTELLAVAFEQLRALSAELPVVMPAHPRTTAAIGRMGITTDPVTLLEPLGYVEFLSLVADARGVLTDSGGLQEETTWLGVPCFTLRSTTERPVTVDAGTNTLLGLEPARIAEIPALLAARPDAAPAPPAGWDGQAARRIADVLEAVPF